MMTSYPGMVQNSVPTMSASTNIGWAETNGFLVSSDTFKVLPAGVPSRTRYLKLPMGGFSHVFLL
jgi:hypothetical protein